MHSKGLSLIELLVSMLILSILLLSIDAMQLRVMHEVQSSYYFGVAAQQINNMIEHLHSSNEANPQSQINIWNQQNQQLLPQGSGEVRGSYPWFDIRIYWGKRNSDACEKMTIGKSGCLRTLTRTQI